MPSTLDGPIGASVKYNPHLWSDDELRAVFVARKRELDDLSRAIRETSPEQVPQHVLITGSRGMGKSTLLRRLALALREDEELHRAWLPVVFPEEQYTVSTLAEFWRNALDAVLDALEREGISSQQLTTMEREAAAITDLPSEERESTTLAMLVAWSASLGRRFVLLVDSTDLLLAALAAADTGRGRKPKGDASVLWRLRKTLLHERCLMWIGASYEAMERDNSYGDAFHDFFDRRELRALTVAEMRAAMIALARRFGVSSESRSGEAELRMQAMIDARPERLRTLRVLTGGNPRTTVMLYDLFATRGDNDGDVYADLRALLDLMTPLYKARMEQLADQPRKLLAHLMEHWAPMSSASLSEASGIATTTVSGQLSRLEAEGLVEKTTLPGTSKAGFQVTERFFNIWYLMRHAPRRLRQRLAWLVEFLRIWYQQPELEAVARRRTESHRSGGLRHVSQLEFSRAMVMALDAGSAIRDQLEWTAFDSALGIAASEHRLLEDVLPGLYEFDGEDRCFLDAEAYRRAFGELAANLGQLRQPTGPEREEFVSRLLGSVVTPLTVKRRIAAAARTLTATQAQATLAQLREEERWSVQRFGASAWSALFEAVLHGGYEPQIAEPQRFSLQLSSLRESPNAYLLAMFTAGNTQGVDAINALYARRPPPSDVEPAFYHALCGGILSQQLHRAEEAVEAFRQAVAADPNHATWWNEIGRLCSVELNRGVEAEEAFCRAIDINPTLALAWNNLGNLLQDRFDRYEEAEAAYRKAIDIDRAYALPWNGLGNLLQRHLKRYDDAEDAYREALRREPSYAAAWVGLGNLLSRGLEREEEAESAYRRALELEPRRADAWFNLACILEAAPGKHEQAHEAYRRVVEIEADLAPVAMVRLGRQLADTGQPTEATEWFRRAARGCATQLVTKERSLHAGAAVLANIWLDNKDAAAQALAALTEAASSGDERAWLHVHEVCRDALVLGRSETLAHLMASSPLADYLAPFRAATLLASGVPESELNDLSAEAKALSIELSRSLGKPQP
ncbi:MAG: tetratricopeptide repeat protein [Deltaproteobacteria bacterium]|nr:tetratricopeptide repeat protein [Deltaproteobacteria bacterium]